MYSLEVFDISIDLDIVVVVDDELLPAYNLLFLLTIQVES